MELLFLGGIFAIISIIISVVGLVIGLFFGQILLFDSIVFALVAFNLADYYTGIHPAFCLLIALAVFFIFLMISHTTFGFWLVSIPISLGMALLVTAIVSSSTGGDRVWTYVTMGISFILFLILHIRAKSEQGI